MAAALALTYPEPDIALVTFDLPGKGANILSRGVLDELEALLAQLEQKRELAGVIIRSTKPGTFIAGADLREFVPALRAAKSEVVALCRRGQELFRKLSTIGPVTVAAIDGICVGGGAELAVWCDRRVISNHARSEFGFPEVKLGLFPGWGGTVRLPRLIGLANAVEMITGGESVTPATALSLGLVADVTAPEQLLNAAIAVVKHEQQSGAYLSDREKSDKPLAVNPTELQFLAATASAMIQRETKGHYPAPPAALELMLETCQLPVDEALAREAAGMAELFGSPVNCALLNVFFLTDRNKRDPGLDRPVPPAAIAALGVVGSGIMGSGIAGAALRSGVPVAITDMNEESLAKGARQALEDAAYSRVAKAPDLQQTLKLAPLLSVTRREEEIAACDLVVEAILEKEDAKKELYQRLERHMKPTAILASNTSTIPITQLAEGLARPEQFCGMHFFNPVRRMKLVEVIRGRQTSDATVATAVAFAKRIGKSPIVVNDGPGFLVNRLLFPYLNEAIELLCEGATMKEIDRAATAFGMPLGPIALYDMVGLDTALYAGKVMYQAFPDRTVASPLVPALVKQGRLGQKSGRGFYSYENKKHLAEADPAAEKIVATYQRAERKLTGQELTWRLFLPMLLEATRILEERIVRDVRDVDLGLIFGLGFPPFKGGLLHWADTLGASKILEALQPLEALGPRFRPPPMLQEMAASNGKFYPQGGC